MSGIADVDDRVLRRGGAEPDPERPPVRRQREVPRPELEPDAADDGAAREIDRQDLDPAGVAHERIAPVAGRVARLLEARDLVAHAELVDHAHRADGRMGDDGDAADALDAPR